MLLNVSDALKNPGQSYPFSFQLALEKMDVQGETVRFDQVSVSGEVIGAEESASVKGRVSAVLNARCARCLEPVALPVSAVFDEVFVKTPDPEDPDQRLLDGFRVPMDDVVREALLLEMPMRIVCSEQCKGLCPICGANQNIQRCTCQEGGKRQNPFSALSELLTEDEEV